MQVTFDIPDTYANALKAAGRDPARIALEALLVEAYRGGHLSEGQIKHILGYGTRIQVHQLLKDHGVPLDITLADLHKDIETLRRQNLLDTAAAA
jgi:hypothetical protein